MKFKHFTVNPKDGKTLRKHPKGKCTGGLDWVVGFKANCPLVGPGPVEGVLSVGVFLKDPSQLSREFQRKTRKTPNG